ncbi:MAG: peptidylprolyl isomerase [Candidatus Omnitrophota bacterium]|jgi:peptidylprolyl isomerase
MAYVKHGDTVKTHYTGTLNDGTIFDDSLTREPLQFKVGDNALIPGFEEAIIGMKTGEWKTVKISAEKAYGRYRQDLVIAAELRNLPPDIHPVVGQQLQINQDNGTPLIVTITEITKTKVVLDANHPLAGEDLTFEINLVEILPP